LLVANEGIQKYMVNLRDQQQLLLMLADMIIDIYLMDSAVARVLLMHQQGTAQRIHDVMAHAVCIESLTRNFANIDALLPSLASGDALTALRGKVDHLRLRPDTDLIAAKKEIAAW